MTGASLWALFVLVCSTMLLYYKANAVLVVPYRLEANSSGDYTRFFRARKLVRSYTFFFLLEGGIIWLSLEFLYMLNQRSWGGLVEDVVKTGIFVPVVFLICSAFIRKVLQKIIEDYNVSDKEISETVIMEVVLFNCIFMITEWRFGLFVLAILLGKIVWLDGTIQEIAEFIKNVFRYQLTDGETITSDMLRGFSNAFFLYLTIGTMMARVFVKF